MADVSDFWEVVQARRSVRHYQQEDVSQAQIERMLQAAIRAPSAGNLQSWHFLVVRNPSLRRAMAGAAWQRFVGEAPVVLVVCADVARSASVYGQRGASLYCLQDTAAALENLLLAATAMGLGACWVGAFDEGAVSKALNLPRQLRPVALVPVGHPAGPTPRTPRHPVVEVSRFVN